jgi:hypothetical protein
MNVYNRSENIGRVDLSADRGRIPSMARPVPRPAPQPNNVFAGKDGKVYQRDDNGNWKQREGRKWKPTTLPSPSPAERPAIGSGPPGHPVPKPSQPAVQPQPEKPTRDRPPQPRESVPPPSPKPAAPTPATPPKGHPTPPAVRPAPPSIRPAAGDLEREYRARERSVPREKPGTPPSSARPAAPQQEKQKEKAQKPQQEKPPKREKENHRP